MGSWTVSHRAIAHTALAYQHQYTTGNIRILDYNIYGLQKYFSNRLDFCHCAVD